MDSRDSHPVKPDPSAGRANDDRRLTELLSQIRYLLDDERSLAERLVGDRKLKLSVLGLVVGLGLFNLESAPSMAATAEAVWGGWPFLVAAFLAAASFFIALMLLLFERSPFPRPIRGPLRSVGRVLGARESAAPPRDADPRDAFGAALAPLFGDPRDPGEVPPASDHLKTRIAEHRIAYLRLAPGEQAGPGTDRIRDNLVDHRVRVCNCSVRSACRCRCVQCADRTSSGRRASGRC